MTQSRHTLSDNEPQPNLEGARRDDSRAPCLDRIEAALKTHLEEAYRFRDKSVQLQAEQALADIQAIRDAATQEAKMNEEEIDINGEIELEQKLPDDARELKGFGGIYSEETECLYFLSPNTIEPKEVIAYHCPNHSLRGRVYLGIYEIEEASDE